MQFSSLVFHSWCRTPWLNWLHVCQRRFSLHWVLGPTDGSLALILFKSAVGRSCREDSRLMELTQGWDWSEEWVRRAEFFTRACFLSESRRPASGPSATSWCLTMCSEGLPGLVSGGQDGSWVSRWSISVPWPKHVRPLHGPSKQRWFIFKLLLTTFSPLWQSILFRMVLWKLMFGCLNRDICLTAWKHIMECVCERERVSHWLTNHHVNVIRETTKPVSG